MHDSARDGSEAVGMFPGRFGAVLKFFHTQFCRLENDVLAVVEFPISGQDAPLGLEAFVKRGVWKRRHYGEARQVYPSLNGEFRRFQKHIRPVVIEAKNKAALKCDPVLVKSLDHAYKLVGRVKCLMALAKVLR